MGSWTTLHLFSDETFYKETVPTLKGEKGDIESDYLDFLRYHSPGRISRLSKQEIKSLVEQDIARIIKISNSLDATFKVHHDFHKIENQNVQKLYLNKLEGYYDFCKFFEYLTFKTCADFFPYLPLGKGRVLPNFDIHVRAIAYSIINELDSCNEFISGAIMGETGVTNWITGEDVELLYLDKKNLHFEDNVRTKGFLSLLDIAHLNKLGLIMGVDMTEYILELLPANKLISRDIWLNIDTTGLVFKH